MSVAWFWASDSKKGMQDQWTKYSDAMALKLEAAFHKSKDKVKIDDERYVDLSDKNSMWQRRYDDESKMRKVKREELSDSDDDSDDKSSSSSNDMQTTTTTTTTTKSKTTAATKSKSKSANSNTTDNDKVTWYWAADTISGKSQAWVPYPDDTTEKLEKAFSRKQKTSKLNDERFVDMKNKNEMWQVRYDDKTKMRRVIRCDVGEDPDDDILKDVAKDSEDTKAKKTTKRKPTPASPSSSSSSSPSPPPSPPPSKKQKTAKSQKTTTRAVDSACPLGSVTVYSDYDCVLNQTNIANNNNKFYVIQMLKASDSAYYVWNRWGRVGEPGQTMCHGPMSFSAAEKNFEKKFKDKTSNSWDQRDNFQAVSGKYTLIKLNVGSTQTTTTATTTTTKTSQKPQKSSSKLDEEVQDLVRYLYEEAKLKVTSTIDANITENGIETPLGVLALEQVEKGENILMDLLAEVKSKNPSGVRLQQLSSDFFTNIPHRFGRSKPPVINTLAMVNDKCELLELLRDMVSLSSKSTKTSKVSVLHTDSVDAQYQSLTCDIRFVDKASKEHQSVVKSISDSVKKSHGGKAPTVKRVFAVTRENEATEFDDSVGNVMQLYHGSRIANWVGLLSRGILLPKVVVSMGINRTDAGWLGSGIYFGEADTAYGYAGCGKRKTRFMLCNDVAIGKHKDYTKITYGITAPPKGFDSCHGVKGTEFYDDEWVVYRQEQRMMKYLVEMS